MASVLLLGANGPLDFIIVSSKESETHNFSAQATETPIQNGSIVSDHVILKPRVLDVMFSAANAQGNGQSPQTVYSLLSDKWSKRELITAYTEHGVIADMVIVGFTPTHKAPNKGALSCNIRLQQLKFPSLAKVPYANVLIPSAALETNRGSAAAKTVSPGKIPSLMSVAPGSLKTTALPPVP